MVDAVAQLEISKKVTGKNMKDYIMKIRLVKG